MIKICEVNTVYKAFPIFIELLFLYTHFENCNLNFIYLAELS